MRSVIRDGRVRLRDLRRCSG